MVNSGDVLLRRPQHASPVGIRAGGQGPHANARNPAYCDGDSSGEEQRTRSPSPSPPPSVLAAERNFGQIVKDLEQLFIKESALPEHGAGLPILDNLSRHFALNALFVDMAWNPEMGDILTVDSLVADFKLDRHHQQLLGTMLTRLEPDILTRLPSQYDGGADDLLDFTWEVTGLAPNPAHIRQELKELQTELVLEHPALAPELNFLNHVGPQLYACIRGRANAREILYPSKESPGYRHSLLSYYEHSQRVQEGQVSLLKESVGQYVLGMASDSAVETENEAADTPLLRILEVGASGSCAATVPVLRHLVSVYKNNSGLFPTGALQRIVCTYTDSSSIALGKAKAVLEAEFPDSEIKFEFKALDIEAEPAPAPDAAAETKYDIILAANALHGAKYLDDALNHVRRLLKSGGILALGEIFASSPFLECTLGVSEGWWRHTDRVRAGGPLLSGPQWEATLRVHGFDHAKAACSGDADFGVVFAS